MSSERLSKKESTCPSRAGGNRRLRIPLRGRRRGRGRGRRWWGDARSRLQDELSPLSRVLKIELQPAGDRVHR